MNGRVGSGAPGSGVSTLTPTQDSLRLCAYIYKLETERRTGLSTQ